MSEQKARTVEDYLKQKRHDRERDPELLLELGLIREEFFKKFQEERREDERTIPR